VPFIVRWPGHVKAGSTSDQPLCLTDVMATVAAITGADLPHDAAEDSFNILPALRGEKYERPIRPATVHHAASGKFAIRRGDFVLIDALTGDDNGGPQRRGEPQWFKDQRGYKPNNQPGELFNVAKDLAQRDNLYAQQPEIVRELKELLEKYKREGRSRM